MVKLSGELVLTQAQSVLNNYDCILNKSYFLQHRGTISSNMYLILEAKGKGKTHEAVDYVAVSLGELFAGTKQQKLSVYELPIIKAP